MNDPAQELVTALRDELRQYGTLLGLIEQHQTFIVERRTQDLLEAVDAVNAQTIAVEAARHARECSRRSLALALGLPEQAKFSELLPGLSAAGRTMVQALVDENNLLLGRIQQRARQNQMLLRRSLDLMQQFMERLFPSVCSTGYDGTGRRMEPAAALRRVYEAVV